MVFSVGCNTASTGYEWTPMPSPPQIMKPSTTVQVPPGCVTPDGAAPGAQGVHKWAFEATATGEQEIVFRRLAPGYSGRGEWQRAERAVVYVTVK